MQYFDFQFFCYFNARTRTRALVFFSFFRLRSSPSFFYNKTKSKTKLCIAAAAVTFITDCELFAVVIVFVRVCVFAPRIREFALADAL